MGKRRVIEVAASGIDDSLQGFSSSPYPVRGTPSSFGLRVPPTYIPGQRFLFCLATVNLEKGGRIRGLRQGLTLGIDTNNTTFTSPPNPTRIVESWVTTQNFRFSDGNVSWHLVKEPSHRGNAAPTNAQNWVKGRSDGPAMLYQTFTNTNVTSTGAPVLYYDSLTAYTPPDLTQQWEDVGGLSCFYDLRFPYQNNDAWNSLDIPVIAGRYSLYASLLQTNPSGRINASYPTAPTSGLGNVNLDFGVAIPEESFIGNFAVGEGSSNGTGVVFWRVMGSMIVELDDETPCCASCGAKS